MAEKIKINKRGQMAIWVIVAMAFVISIVLFFFLRGDIKPETGERIEENPTGFVSNCVRGSVNDVIDIILAQGGFANPEHSKYYNGINISYLCYNAGNYNPCINEHPILINEIKEEIKNYIAPKVEQCFQDYKSEIKKRNAEIELGVMNLELKLAPDRIFVNIEREVDIKSKEQSFSYDRFDVEIISPLYNIARVAMEIASQEAKYCYFEYVGYMILYPKFIIERDSLSDSTEIYIIKDKKSRKEMNIAIRSCAIPPGL